MSTYFAETFATYSPGYDGPFNDGVFDGGTVFRGQVVDFGTMTGSTPAVGFYERLGHGFSFGLGHDGPLEWQTLTPINTMALVWAGFYGNDFAAAGPVSYLDIATLTSGTGIAQSYMNLAQMNINADFTVSLYLNSINGSPTGGPVATSLSQVIYPGVWHYFQSNYSTFDFPIVVGTTTTLFIGITGTFAIDGTQILVGTGISNAIGTNQYTGGSFFNQIRFVGGGYVGEIYGYSAASMGTFPNPGTPRNLRYTQSVAEVVQNFQEPHLRMTQAVNEVSMYPGQRNLRMTQAVVEIVIKGQVVGWIVYET